ncbi:MAG TPA: type II secretion system protein E [Chloroflexota bacterium]|nr:type II secretion system protein E [Chloroflexota bacterium]
MDDDARVALFREHPPGWWGWPWRLPRPLTVPELIQAGSLDASLAALLWLALERRASIIVAAGPNGAGKTVTLSALLDFLPPAVRRVHLQGMAEDFSFVGAADPGQTYLLANEISDHLPIYLWGRRAQRLFELLPEGYALGATLHAESVGQVLGFLTSPPLGIPERLVAAVDFVMTLALTRGSAGVVRRVEELCLLEQGARHVRYRPLFHGPAEGTGLVSAMEGQWSPLARRLGMDTDELRSAHAARAEWLTARVAAGDTGPARWRAALAAYRAGRGA